MSTRTKASPPVILNPPTPWSRKLLQSYSHSIRQAEGARNPGLRRTSLPSAARRTSAGLLVGPNDVGGTVVVGAAIVVGDAVVVVGGGPRSCRPRQPGRAVSGGSPVGGGS